MRSFLVPRFLNVLCALLLMVSMAAMPVIAYAEDTTGSAPQGSPAKSNPQTTDGQGGTKACRDTYTDAKGGVLLGVIVPCITHTMEEASQTMAAKFINATAPLVAIFITLVVVLFGVKVMEGQPQRLKGEAFLLILKIAMVVGLLQLVPGTLIPAAYNTILDGQAIPASAIDASSIHCPISNYGDSNTPALWKEMDCVAGKLFGFAMGQQPSGGTGPNMLLMSSAFGLLGGFFFGGTFGLAVFMACIGVLFSAIMIVIRTAMAFINGFMHLSIMFILSPLFLPLTLLKPTQNYFQAWWSSIAGAIIMPVVVAVYATFALLLYDQVLFAPNSMFQKLFDPSFTKYVESMPRKPFDYHVTGDDKDFAAKLSGQTAQQILGSVLYKQDFVPTIMGASELGGGFQEPQLDVSQIKDANGNPYPTKEAWFMDLFKGALKIFITSMLISSGFNSAMKAAQNFTGSFVAAQNVIANPIGDRIQQAMQGVGDSVKEGLTTKKEKGPDGKERVVNDEATGAEFVKRLGSVPENVVRGFIGGIGGGDN